jgi:hypothetical protein
MKMNMKKTNIMCNIFSGEMEIHVNTMKIENVDEYVCLGEMVILKNDKKNENEKNCSRIDNLQLGQRQ